MTTDLSDTSWSALPFARDLAERYGAELTVCSVVEEPPRYEPTGQHRAVEPRLEEWLEDAGSKTRDQIATKLAEESLDATVIVVRSLNPTDTILEQARQSEADLIVMATHGRTGVRHLLLGSTAEKILRQSTVPVLTVRADMEA